MLFFYSVLFIFLEALHGVKDRSANMLAMYVTFGTFWRRVCFPWEFKFRSTEILRNSVLKGELWIFLLWKLSLLNSTNDSVQLYPHLTWETRIVTWVASSSHSRSFVEPDGVLPRFQAEGLYIWLFSPFHYFKSCLVAYLPKKGC